MRDDLQRIATEQLGQREGSVVALDPRTGEILTMVSFPSYDPNVLANHNTTEAAIAQELLDASPEKPRLAALLPGAVLPGLHLQGGDGHRRHPPRWRHRRRARLPASRSSYTPPGTTRPIRNFGGSSCGGALFEILRVSCNTAFAQMGVDTGPDPMVEVSEDFGFNQAVPIDLTAPARSNFPTDFEQNLPALAQSSIGQNDVAATPLQMAMVAAAVANGGEVMAPHVLRDVRDPDGNVVDTYDPEVWTTAMDEPTANLMREAMRGVVESGTATRPRRARLRRGRQDRHRAARHRSPAVARVGARVRRSARARNRPSRSR